MTNEGIVLKRWKIIIVVVLVGAAAALVCLGVLRNSFYLKPLDAGTQIKDASLVGRGVSHEIRRLSNLGLLSIKELTCANAGYQFVEYKAPGASFGTWDTTAFLWYGDGSPVAIDWEIYAYDGSSVPEDTFSHAGNSFGNPSVPGGMLALMRKNAGPIEIAIVHTPVKEADRDRVEHILEVVASRPMSVYHAEQFLILLQEIGPTKNETILKHLKLLAETKEPLLGLAYVGKLIPDASTTTGKEAVNTYSPAIVAANKEEVHCLQLCAQQILRKLSEPTVATAAAPPTEAPATTLAEPSLVILKATWKVRGRPDVDVTKTLEARIKDGRLETKVGATSLGLPSPPQGVTGNLAIVYRINGKHTSRTVPGGGTNLVLEAPQGTR